MPKRLGLGVSSTLGYEFRSGNEAAVARKHEPIRWRHGNLFLELWGVYGLATMPYRIAGYFRGWKIS